MAYKRENCISISYKNILKVGRVRMIWKFHNVSRTKDLFSLALPCLTQDFQSQYDFMIQDGCWSSSHTTCSGQQKEKIQSESQEWKASQLLRNFFSKSYEIVIGKKNEYFIRWTPNRESFCFINYFILFIFYYLIMFCILISYILIYNIYILVTDIFKFLFKF